MARFERLEVDFELVPQIEAYIQALQDAAERGENRKGQPKVDDWPFHL